MGAEIRGVVRKRGKPGKMKLAHEAPSPARRARIRSAGRRMGEGRTFVSGFSRKRRLNSPISAAALRRDPPGRWVSTGRQRWKKRTIAGPCRVVPGRPASATWLPLRKLSLTRNDSDVHVNGAQHASTTPAASRAIRRVRVGVQASACPDVSDCRETAVMRRAPHRKASGWRRNDSSIDVKPSRRLPGNRLSASDTTGRTWGTVRRSAVLPPVWQASG
jgi:hypothetical protein